ncbi:hypothetical protein SAMN02745150_00882 [Brevinema andersonii]|uniref:Uncharacterized protein n=1 Tax=Brevinema andersonii TaxID=34097 RepID=A0A1I1E1D3_BREAD|nr:hypothetical protein [Brevinema andersonii]SFB80877.1 hypothetical protein SAMN02745150_00882 [Brevinema andersonii]
MTDTELNMLLDQLKNENILHKNIDQKFEKLVACEEAKICTNFRLIGSLGVLVCILALGTHIMYQQNSHQKLVLQQLEQEREQIFNNAEYMYSILFTGE